MQKLVQAFAIACFVFLCGNANAQTFTINGKVKDNAGLAVPAATVSVLKASDSSWLKSELATEDGSFAVAGISAGNYVLAVTALGFDNAKQLVTIVNEQPKEIVVSLQKSSTALTEVTVSSKKPFLELGMGKIIMNVENSITNSSNALELLKKSPGVLVDNNGNISMHGKSGVVVMIDDRPTYLSADELADYLKNMSSEEVAQLELITQPSAKYEAEGSAGIINIKTKKSRKEGWNGMVSNTFSQGVYAGNWGDLQLNYYKRKLRLYSITHYNLGTGFAEWTQTDKFLDTSNGMVTGIDYMHSRPKEYFSNVTSRIGADYDWTNNTATGMSVSGNYHPNHMHTATLITAADAQNNVEMLTDRYVKESSLKRNISANAYLKHSFSKENDLNVNLDYIVYTHSYDEFLTSTDYNAQMQPQGDPLILDNNSAFQTNVYSLKADYARALNKTLKIEAGLKSSLVKIDNSAAFTRYVNNVGANDTGLSNHFLFSENINALYVNCHRSIGEKWQIQAGLRAEEDRVYGHQLVHDQSFTRDNIALFPTAFVSYKLNDKHQLEANYGRRVNRPGYGDLNPFKWFTFYNNYRIGNPELLPEYTSNFELKDNYKNTLITTLGYSRTINGLNYATLVQPGSTALYWTPENLASKQNISLTMAFNKALLKWWDLSCSGDVYYEDYNGEVGDKRLEASSFGMVFSMDSQFTISKRWSAELNAWYSAPANGITTRAIPNGALSFGVSKKVLKDAGTVKLSVYDPLATSGVRTIDAQYNFNSRASYYDNGRQSVNLSFSFNFGSKKDNTQRDNSQPDETKRMNM